jgi:hypothetical protein
MNKWIMHVLNRGKNEAPTDGHKWEEPKPFSHTGETGFVLGVPTPVPEPCGLSPLPDES